VKEVFQKEVSDCETQSTQTFTQDPEADEMALSNLLEENYRLKRATEVLVPKKLSSTQNSSTQTSPPKPEEKEQTISSIQKEVGKLRQENAHYQVLVSGRDKNKWAAVEVVELRLQLQAEREREVAQKKSIVTSTESKPSAHTINKAEALSSDKEQEVSQLVCLFP
jgi:hypothetical protein